MSASRSVGSKVPRKAHFVISPWSSPPMAMRRVTATARSRRHAGRCVTDLWRQGHWEWKTPFRPLPSNICRPQVFPSHHFCSSRPHLSGSLRAANGSGSKPPRKPDPHDPRSSRRNAVLACLACPACPAGWRRSRLGLTGVPRLYPKPSSWALKPLPTDRKLCYCCRSSVS